MHVCTCMCVLAYKHRHLCIYYMCAHMYMLVQVCLGRMWRSQTGSKAKSTAVEADDDWETDPDFVVS